MENKLLNIINKELERYKEELDNSKKEHRYTDVALYSILIDELNKILNEYHNYKK